MSRPGFWKNEEVSALRSGPPVTSWLRQLDVAPGLGAISGENRDPDGVIGASGRGTEERGPNPVLGSSPRGLDGVVFTPASCLSIGLLEDFAPMDHELLLRAGRVVFGLGALAKDGTEYAVCLDAIEGGVPVGIFFVLLEAELVD